MTPRLEQAADALRVYLDRVGFGQIYKFIAGSNLYALTPSLITGATSEKAESFFDSVLSDCRDLRLLQCLMFGRPAGNAALSAVERPAAAALVDAGLLRQADDTLFTSGYQLISAFGLDLLIDRRIHFGGDMHDIYIGPDSYWMLYYIDAASVRPGHRALDLCTGSGIGALYLSLFANSVVATDIGDAPLALAAINLRLNGRHSRIDLRRQDLRVTLQGGERFDILTCNPPFVAFPSSLEATLYARGDAADGLGYMRAIIENLPAVLNPGGCAYLVADLVGDLERPHFIEELEGFARSGSMAIDVYIDSVVSARDQIAPLAGYLAHLNRDRDRADIAREVEEFQRSTLRAERYYMSTLRVRTSSPEPDVRIMRRYSPPKERIEWPALLRTS